jgi:hypothetical protein
MSADTEKLIAELRAGLDGVTPGPWHAVQMATNKPDIDRPFVVGPGEVVVGTDGICEPARSNDRSFPEDAANMRHISRCSPDNIRALLDRIASLEAALAPFAKAESCYSRDKSFIADHMEIWRGGDVVLTVGDLRRAVALSNGGRG